MSPEHILAIDLGTSGLKVALVTVSGVIVDHEHRANRVQILAGGGAEQDPEEWWQNIVSATRALLARDSERAQAIVAIGVTSQWMGTVAVDAHGSALSKALIWLDARGARYVAERVGGGFELPGTGYNLRRLMRWIRLTGGVPSRTGKDPVGHILFIKHEAPELYAATHKFLEPMDYLTLRLTGRMAASYASVTGYFCTDNRNLSRVAYDEKLLRWAGLDRDKLPDLVATGSVLGTLTARAAQELGLHSEVKVVTATGDTATAGIGAGAVADYVPHLYIGTSAWLSCHVPFKKTDVRRNVASLPSAIPERYWVATEQDAAGKCLTWLVDNVLYPQDELDSAGPPPDVLQRLDRIAERAPAGSSGTLFLPWLNGERTPVDDRFVRGGWANVKLGTDRACLVRSVFEGVALNARWMLVTAEHLVRHAQPRGFGALRFVGGGARSDVWCQILADVLERPIEQVSQPVLANARGAALAASVALGYLDWQSSEIQPQILRTYQPDQRNLPTYRRQFEAFLRFYRETRATYAWLNREA